MKTQLLFALSIFCAGSALAQFGPQQIISTATPGPYLSILTDIDNDGNIDLLTASSETYNLSWYQNLDGNGNFGDEIIINENPVSYLTIAFVDINGDADEDILYIENNPRQVSWLENLNGMGNYGPEQILLEQDFITSVSPMDMDNDGDLDLIASITDTFSGWVVWHENIDGQGTFGGENLLVENTGEFTKTLLKDIDNDGFIDILATEHVLNSGKIFWYKNMGNASFGPMQVIYQFEYFQSGGTNIIDFQYVDMNTDGKMDIVMTSVFNDEFSSIQWLENMDNQGSFGDLNHIMDAPYSYRFYDLDQDSDNDMLFWYWTTDTLGWKENDGLGNFGPSNTISLEVDFPRDARAADIDGDGLLDVASASVTDNKLAWYKNMTLGVSENETTIFQVFPNPTRGLLSVESKIPVSNISIYTVLGQRIETATENNQIDISKTDAGMYLLKVENENGNSQTFKIIKE